MEPIQIDTAELENKLLYSFKNKQMIQTALCHSSFVNEQIFKKIQNNERLEFLGDAVLNLTISHLLMIHYPDLNEGELSRLRAALVNEQQVSDIARTIDLGGFVLLGKGEYLSNGREKNSILADTYEAVIAAVYLDGGFNTSHDIIDRHFSSLIHSIMNSATSQDFKSRLQEFMQEKYKVTPTYSVLGESGPDHDKTFEIEVEILDFKARGTGKSKKAAEQDAAKNAIEILKQKNEDT